MKKMGIITIIVLAFWACTTFSQSYKSGYDAASNKNWDKAIRYFEKALLEKPNNSTYRLSLLRAKIAASYDHLAKARELVLQGKKEEALTEYKKALSYGALARTIKNEIDALTEEKTKKEKPEIIKIEPPVKLNVDKGKISLKFPVEAPLRSIFQALGKHAQVNIIFDEQFREVPFTIELDDMNFEQALNLLCLTSKNFHSIVDEKTIVIAPDMPQKRAQYELSAIKTFYLSNVKAEDLRTALMTMLRTTYKQPSIHVDKNLNSITIRDNPFIVGLAEKIIRRWDKAKGEVIIDLEIMEVSRIKLRQLGLDLGQGWIGLKYSGAETGDEEGWFSPSDINFSKADYFRISLPSAALQFLESDADTRMISQPRLRGIEGEKIEIMVGDEVPVPRATFTPIAAGGIGQQPVIQYDYKDVGIDVKITPEVHSEGEVTLELEIEIKSIGGAGIAGLPIFTTRRLKNVIRLKDGETNLLAGLLKDEERRTLSGIPYLKDVPILGNLFSSTDMAIQQTDVILTITPYIVRAVSITEEDKKPLWIGPQGISAGRTSVRPMQKSLRDRRVKQPPELKRAAGSEPGQSRIFLSPTNLEARQNREFRISVNARIQEEVGNMALNISFNAAVLRLKDVVKREFLNRLGSDVPFLKSIDNSSGTCTIGFSSTEIGKGLRGTGSLATLIFEPVGKGESIITVTSVSGNSPAGESLSFTTGQSRVIVR
jgi:general secretion pathway protein D